MKNNLIVVGVMLSVFYIFFGYITYSVYDLDSIGWMSLLFLPRTFFESFILFFFYTFILIITSRRTIIYRGLLLILFPLVVIYLIQYFSLLYSGNYIIRKALYEYESAQIFFNTENFIKILAFITIGLVSYLFLKKANMQNNSWSNLMIGLVLLFSGYIISFSSYWVPQRITKSYASSFPRPSSTPEIAFFNQLLIENNVNRPVFKNIEYQILRDQYDIFLRGDSFPYYKQHIVNVDSPSSFNKKKVFNLKEKPNIVIVFTESLSSRFVGCYGSIYDSITPNIDLFAKESLVFDGYFNHTTPTYNGLLGTLCSVYPHFSNIDYESTRQNFNIKSLINILNDSGYSSSMFCYENKGYSLYRLMNSLGFENLFFKQDIERESGVKSLRTDHLSDESLFNYYVDEFPNYISSKEPFIHVLSTIETHIGYKPSESGLKYSKYDNSHLNTLHNFDAQFKKLVDVIETYDDNTIVILTADHSLPLGAGLGDIYNGNMNKNSLFDEIVLIIKLPGVESERILVNNSSISFTPTLLHILGITNVKNNFVGRSMFEKPNLENVIGVNSSGAYVKTNKDKFIISKDSVLIKWTELNKYLFSENQIFPKK